MARAAGEHMKLNQRLQGSGGQLAERTHVSSPFGHARAPPSAGVYKCVCRAFTAQHVRGDGNPDGIFLNAAFQRGISFSELVHPSLGLPSGALSL